MSSGTLYLGENAVSPSVTSVSVKYSAGENIKISDDLVISATDTKYTAGDNITIDDENKISAKTYSAGDNIEITEAGVINSKAFALPDPTGKELSVLMTDGADAYWEKPATFNLLDRKESDHILDDIRWLRADTFSWHSGDMYPAAYEHLADDMSLSSSNNKMTIKGTEYYVWDGGSGTDYYTRSKTPVTGDDTYMLSSGVVERVKFVVVSFDGTTLRVEDENTGSTSDWSKKSLSGVNAIETIGNITIAYYLAEDGHKICLPDQEANIIKLYSATSSSDYYVLDIDNKRFKLPRKNKRKIVHSYKSGYSWYNLYSDGWVEQGGGSSAATTGATVATVTLPIPMKNNQYTLTGSKNDADSGSVGINIGTTRTTTQFTWSVAYSSSLTRSMMWRAEGYASPDIITDIAFIFEYYYVGEFNKTSIEQAASITAETLNSKMDVPTNVSQDDIDFVIEWQKPTAENSYTWYRKYKSGWVEQGGRVNLNGVISETNKRVVFPIEMANTKYMADCHNNANTGSLAFVGWESTTGMSVGVQSGTTTGQTTWYVCGMAA